MAVRLFSFQPTRVEVGMPLRIPIYFPILFNESSLVQIHVLKYLPSMVFFTKGPGCKQQRVWDQDMWKARVWGFPSSPGVHCASLSADLGCALHHIVHIKKRRLFSPDWPFLAPNVCNQQLQDSNCRSLLEIMRLTWQKPRVKATSCNMKG